MAQLKTAWFTASFALAYICLSQATPAVYTQRQKDLPAAKTSSTRGYVQPGDQLAMESNENSVTTGPEARFGYPVTGLGAVGGTSLVPGLGGSLKLDLGGLLLGAALGFGVVLLLPKLLHVLEVTPSHHDHYDSGYRRSEEATSEKLMSVLSRVDAALARHNVDSSSCVQRAVCSQVRAAAEHVHKGAASSWDEMIAGAASNSLTSFLLDGTSVKQAVEQGQAGADCDALYARCSLNKEALVAAITGLTQA